MLTVTRIRNILEAPERREPPTLLQWRPGIRIADCAPKDFDLEGGHAVIVNHRALTGVEVETMVLEDGAEIVLGDVPKVFESLGGSVAGVLVGILIIGAMIGLQFGIAALTAPKMPRLPGDQSDGPARNWEGIQDTAGNGRPIPFVYGQVRTGGHFLQSFERALTGAQVRHGLTTLHTLMAICLGPIESITDCQVNGNLAETIPDFSWEARLGTATQPQLSGFHLIVHEVVHERAIMNDDGWQTYITTEAVEALEVTFRFPQGLYIATAGGTLNPRRVVFSYKVRPFGGNASSTIASGTSEAIACTRSPYKAQLLIDDLPLGLYEIRIHRDTADADEFEIANRIDSSEVYAISEITYEARAHPGLALVGLRQLPSEQINASVPTTYTFLVKGFNDIRIYSTESTYTVGWSDNPAWCLAHFLTSPIHGLGDKYTWDSIDIPSFLAWAAYCDEMVDRGDGVLEKRCTFNHVFDAITPTDEAIQVFSQGTGALVIKRGSKWRIVLDQADSMIWLAGEGNILPGTMKLTYPPLHELANRIHATFANAENDYQRDTISDELPDLPAGTKYVERQVEMWGVTRPSQAAREVRRLLMHNRCALTQIEFEAGLDALQVSAGSIFGVSMKTTAVGLASGRLLGVDVTGTHLTLDEQVTLEAGRTYEIVVHHGSNDTITTKRIVFTPGTYERIGVADATWTGTIRAGDLYAIGEVASSVEKFRCSEISLSDDFRRKIKGVRYDPTVYTFDLEAVPEVIRSSIPDPRLFPPDPVDLTLAERQETEEDGTISTVLDVDWIPPVSTILDHFDVFYRPTDGGVGGWVLAGEARVGHLVIPRLTAGVEYEVSVISVSAAGVRKAPDDGLRRTIFTQGQTEQPPTLSNLQAVVIDGSLIATVDPLDDDELGPGGYYEWRRGATWTQAQLLDYTTSPRIELRSYARGTATILVKAVNSYGNPSPSAVSVSIDLYGQVEENIVLEQEEAPGWSGTLVGFTVEGGTNKLSLLTPGNAAPFIPQARRRRRQARAIGWGAPAAVSRTLPEGSYTSGVVTVSSGSAILARPDISVEWEAIYIGLGTFDAATFSFDSPQADIPFSGEEADAVSLIIQSRHSTTDTEEASFSAWADHRDRGEVLMKYFQFRVIARTASPAYSAKISGIALTIDVPDKTTSGKENVASPNPVTVTYPTSYFVAVKRLLVTLIGGTAGDYVRVTAEDATGFTAEIRTAMGSLTTGNFHYEARGY